MAGTVVPGTAGAALPEGFWAQAGLAVSREAIAAAKISQRGGKRSFLVIILGIPCLFSRSGEPNLNAGKEKSSVGSR
jgi:hypothetical protein